MQKPTRRPAAQRNRRTTRTRPAKTPTPRDQTTNAGSSSREADASQVRKRGGLLMAAGLASGAAALLYSWIGRGRRQKTGPDTSAETGGSELGANRVSPVKSLARKLRSSGANSSSSASQDVSRARGGKRANTSKEAPAVRTATDRPAPGENALPRASRGSRGRTVAAEATAPTNIGPQSDGAPRKRGRPRKNPIEGEVSMRANGRTANRTSAPDAISVIGAFSATEIQNTPSPLIPDPAASRSTEGHEEPTILFSTTGNDESSAPADPTAPAPGRKRGRPAKAAPNHTRDPIDAA